MPKNEIRTGTGRRAGSGWQETGDEDGGDTSSATGRTKVLHVLVLFGQFRILTDQNLQIVLGRFSVDFETESRAAILAGVLAAHRA